MRKAISFGLASLLTLGSAGCSEMLESLDQSSTSSPARAPSGTAVSGRYTVTIGVTNRAGRVGALQFDARVDGSWQGTGGKVACRNLSGAGMMACNNKGGGLLSCALVHESGISTPTALVACSLDAADGLGVDDIRIKVVDATAPDVRPLSVKVSATEVARR